MMPATPNNMQEYNAQQRHLVHNALLLTIPFFDKTSDVLKLNSLCKELYDIMQLNTPNAHLPGTYIQSTIQHTLEQRFPELLRALGRKLRAENQNFHPLTQLVKSAYVRTLNIPFIKPTLIIMHYTFTLAALVEGVGTLLGINQKFGLINFFTDFFFNTCGISKMGGFVWSKYPFPSEITDYCKKNASLGHTLSIIGKNFIKHLPSNKQFFHYLAYYTYTLISDIILLNQPNTKAFRKELILFQRNCKMLINNKSIDRLNELKAATDALILEANKKPSTLKMGDNEVSFREIAVEAANLYQGCRTLVTNASRHQSAQANVDQLDISLQDSYLSYYLRLVWSFISIATLIVVLFTVFLRNFI